MKHTINLIVKTLNFRKLINILILKRHISKSKKALIKCFVMFVFLYFIWILDTFLVILLLCFFESFLYILVLIKIKNVQ